jgi:hypothetical protein
MHICFSRDAAPTELGLVLDSIAIEIALLTELDPAHQKSQRADPYYRPLTTTDRSDSLPEI